MTINRIDSGLSLTELAQLSSTKPQETNGSYSTISFQNSKNNATNNLENHMKQSPLDDRVPNDRSLAKLGFKKSDMVNRTYGQMYEDGKGNTIYIGSFGADMESGVNGALRVRYESKDGMIHEVYFDPDGNPIKGKLQQSPKLPGDPIETYKYDYDINGGIVVTEHRNEYPYYDKD